MTIPVPVLNAARFLARLIARKREDRAQEAAAAELHRQRVDAEIYAIKDRLAALESRKRKRS